MNQQTITLLALAFSVLCLLYLRNTNPKRYSAHRLPVSLRLHYPMLGWLLCLTPGILLLLLEYYASFILWFAALTVIGWLIALPRPK